MAHRRTGTLAQETGVAQTTFQIPFDPRALLVGGVWRGAASGDCDVCNAA